MNQAKRWASSLPVNDGVPARGWTFGSERRCRLVLGAAVSALLIVALATSWLPVRWAREHQQQGSLRGLLDPSRVRSPSGAGSFYPDEPKALTDEMDAYLAAVPPTPQSQPRALVVPFGRYRFAGPSAAFAYRQLRGHQIETVVLMGSSHSVPFAGVSVLDADAYRTPLGWCRLSAMGRELRDFSPFTSVAEAHAQELALEVQLPFLQRVVGDFELVPLLFGKVDPRAVAQVLTERVTPKTLVVASVLLGPHDSPKMAHDADSACLEAVVRLDIPTAAHTCGKLPILTVLHLATLRGWVPQRLDYRAGEDPKGRIVGYAAIAFYEPT